MGKDITPKDPKKIEAQQSDSREPDRAAKRKSLGFRVGRKTGRKTNARGMSDRVLKERVIPVDWS